MVPCGTQAMKAASRNALLAAIAKARGWIEDMKQGRVTSLAEIARVQMLLDVARTQHIARIGADIRGGRYE